MIARWNDVVVIDARVSEARDDGLGRELRTVIQHDDFARQVVPIQDTLDRRPQQCRPAKLQQDTRDVGRGRCGFLHSHSLLCGTLLDHKIDPAAHGRSPPVFRAGWRMINLNHRRSCRDRQNASKTVHFYVGPDSISVRNSAGRASEPKNPGTLVDRSATPDAVNGRRTARRHPSGLACSKR